MADPFDPADPRVLSQIPGQRPGPLLGAPAPDFQGPADLFGGRDEGVGMMMMQYMPQIMSVMGIAADKFLPQQIPAQALMDQMTSEKYMRENRTTAASFAPQDQNALFQRLANITGATTDLGKAQVNNFAEQLNSPLGQMIAGSIVGPQNVEDLFFGRRGSAVQMANSVNNLGFYRPDSVDGGSGMSAESRQQFTDQLYSNFYGPGADLNDVSGLSAGRMGSVANDLAQRGLLPVSMGMLPESQRRQELRKAENRPANLEENVARDIADARFMKSNEKFGPDDAADDDKKTYAQFTPQERREFLDARMRQNDNEIITASRGSARAVLDTIDNDDSKTTEEIKDMEGGSSAVRRVDATRVGNKLKEYTGAIDAVRSIFGDNGMGNAPMQQLIAALDSLSQGGMSSMQPGKLENIMRRTQMASRDAGVSMEALMGLTARGGALADQNGLARDMVPGAVIATMERGAAMRDQGAFAPGFGKADSNTAMLRVMDQTVQADASNASRLASVARRIVKENEGNAEFAGRAGTEDLKSFVAAMERGDSTFTNAAGKVVNINEQMGQNSGAFFQDMFKQAGLSDDEVSARFYDEVNTQEYLMPGFTAAAQRYEVTQQLGGFFAQDFIEGRGKNLSAGDRQKLAASMGRSFSTAMIDEVDSSLTPAERVEVLQASMRRGASDYVREQAESRGETLTAEQLETKTTELLTGPDGVFKDAADMRSYVETQQANLGMAFEGETGMNINAFRQLNSFGVLARQEERRRRNNARANMLENLGGSVTGDGSNILQRFSDYFLTGGTREDGTKANFAEYVLNAVDTEAYQNQLIDAAGGRESFDAAMGTVDRTLEGATIDTDGEINAAVNEVLTAPNRQETFGHLRDRLEATPGGKGLLAGKETVISTDELSSKLSTAGSAGGLDDKLKAAYRTVYGGSETEVNEKFAGDRDAAMRELAVAPKLEQVLTNQGFNQDQMQQVGLLDADKKATVVRESDLREDIKAARMAAGAFGTAEGRDEATMNAIRRQQAMTFSSEMARGKLTSETVMSVAGVTTPEERAQRDKILGRVDALEGLDKPAEEARMLALQEAVSRGDIDASTGIAKDVAAMDDGTLTDEERASARRRVERVTKGDEREFRTAIEQVTTPGSASARSGIKAALDSALTEHDDPEKLKSLQTTLQSAVDSGDITEKQRDDMMAFAGVGRTMAATGGLTTMSGYKSQEQLQAVSRMTALTEAVNNGKIKDGEGSTLVQDVKTMQDTEASDADRSAARERVEAVTGDKEKFERAVTTLSDAEGGSNQEARAAVLARAEDFGKQTAGMLGPAGDMLSQLGTAISDAFGKVAADLFKDVKIENVTITNLKLPSLLGGLGATLFGGEADNKATADKPDAAGKEADKPAADKTSETPAEKQKEGEAANADATAKDEKKEDSNQMESLLASVGAALQTMAAAALSFGSQKTGEQKVDLTGTLTLNGLSEVVADLAVSGMEQPPGNGAPILPNRVGNGTQRV
jgi:hypothetical protein